MKKQIQKVEEVSLSDRVAEESEQRKIMTNYIRDHMKAGIDYYTLQIGGRETKPSLSKAGSEKFISLLKLNARFRKDDETWEMLGKPAGILCYICELFTSNGKSIGEGRGSRDAVKDRDINKAIKMAEKSAQIDAILRTGALSDYFSQDLENQEIVDDDSKKKFDKMEWQRNDRVASEKQIHFIESLGRNKSKTREEIEAFTVKAYGKKLNEITMNQASYLIGRLQNDEASGESEALSDKDLGDIDRAIS